jgi:hypothetical protein
MPIKISTIAARVAVKLSEKDTEANARQIAVTDIVVSDVKRRTKIYNVDGYAMLVLPNGVDRSFLIAVVAGSVPFMSYIKNYGIARPDWIDACGKAINIEANQPWTPRDIVHSLSHWDGDKKQLFVNCYDGSMLRIWVYNGKAAIQREPVGTDGVLMRRYASSLDDLSGDAQPWLQEGIDLDAVQTGSLQLRDESLIDELILSCVKYEGDTKHHKQMLKAFLMSLFFASPRSSKPVLALEGTGGGGKSAVGLCFGTMLMGRPFAVSTSPKTADQVAEFISDRPFVVFDEFDSIPKAVEKEFKTLTTGGKHSRRELYATSKTVRLTCDASVMVTTNSASLKEAGSSRRFIVIPVAPRQTEVGDKVFHSMAGFILPKLLENRSALWLELLGDLAACVLAFNATEVATMTSFSMADFGVDVQRCADYEGWGKEAEAMFAHTERKQGELTAKSRLVPGLLTDLLHRQPELQGKALTASDWTGHLQTIIPSYEVELSRKVNQFFLSWELKTYADTFAQQFSMVVGWDSHGKINTYSFRLPVEKVVQMSGAA